MALIEDTRQQRGKHDLKEQFFDDSGECVVRCALPVGDYQRPARVAVDTKKDIIELGTNLKKDHERFARECKKAKELGTQLVILVENTDNVRNLADLSEWVESEQSYKNRNRSGKAVRYTGRSIAKACETMHRHYGVLFGFCSPAEAGQRVIKILDAYEG